MLLQAGECVPTCHHGYYRVTDQSKCLACYPGCMSCLSASNGKCLSCEHPWQVLDDGKCRDKCRPGTYRHGQMCESMYDGIDGDASLVDYSSGRFTECDDDRCVPCLQDEKTRQCLGCASGLVLQGSICVAECNHGFYRSDGLCEGNVVKFKLNLCCFEELF